MPKTTRTAGSYLRVIEQRIGSDETELDHLVSINHAASALENARRWEWMREVGATVTLTAGATYVDLPTDVRDVIDVKRDGAAFDMEQATLAQIQGARASGSLSGFMLWHHAREVYSEATRTYRARLEVYPAPTSDLTLHVLYAARIPRVNSDDDVVVIPDWLDGLFEHLCCAVASGREEPELGSVESNVAAALGGRLYYDATQRDGSMQDVVAPFQGGAVEGALLRAATRGGSRWRVTGGSL